MEFNFADSAKKMRSSAIRDLMSLAVRPDIISFAGGMPGNDLFPIDDLREIVAQLPTKRLEIAMQYGETSGMNTLIIALKNWLQQKGFPVDKNRIILTTGSLQALHILGKIFINPGDTILVENPSFVGALSAFKSFEANIVGVNIDKNGICIDDLREKLKLNPKFLYIMPNFHNPAGIIYSQQRRTELLQLMQEYNVPIFEDDAYGELFYDEETKSMLSPLKTIAKNEEQILYTGSFSKIFGPGLRLGWMLVPPEVYEKAEKCKQAIDACSSTLSQTLAEEFLTSGRMEKYIVNLRNIYRQRRDCMVEELKKHMPAEVSFVEPKGGFYIWIKLPEGVNEKELLKIAIEKGVVFVIGSTFDPLGNENGYIRISFSNNTIEEIQKGIKILGESIKYLL